jgi:protoporphyrinogen/coproporphyrinogen III oxidase
MRTKMRIAAEWFHPPNQATEDETVAAMVERHYGSEMVDLLADPLLSGVYGGEAAHLSVRAVLPRFAEMEAKHGSLGRAMLAARSKTPAATKSPAPPIFTSLKDGMQQMIDALVARLDPKAMKTSSSVKSVLAENGHGWTVHAEQRAQFDAVIIATATHTAAAMLQSADPKLAHIVSDIQYSSSVTVTLGYDEKVRRSLPPGFGFLVPRREGCRMLAATFVHNKFPHRAPENRAIVRCFLGGSRDEHILQSSEAEILQIVRRELRQILGDALTAEPLFARVYKWKSAMAQYSVGHLERLQRIESLRQKLPGLALAGNGYSGIGVPDCVRSGAEAAAKVLTEIGIGQSSA